VRGLGLRSGQLMPRSADPGDRWGGAKCLLKEGFDFPWAIKLAVMGQQASALSNQREDTERVPAGAASPRRVIFSIDAIDRGFSLSRRRRSRKEAAAGTARWATETEAPAPISHSSASGAEGQWFGVKDQQGGGHCWVRCAAPHRLSLVVCSRAESLPADQQADRRSAAAWGCGSSANGLRKPLAR